MKLAAKSAIPIVLLALALAGACYVAARTLVLSANQPSPSCLRSPK